MVSTTTDSSAAAAGIHGHKLSTVVPAHVTGHDVDYALADMDLVMKLHYLRAVYYFRDSDVVAGLTAPELKASMFPWLDIDYPLAGRIRRSEAGRPHVKCNDSGVRIVEATCGQTMDEWLETAEAGRCRHLVYDKVLGPDLHFSPLVYVQFTRFKCGGMAVGLSWAHVLGDAVSASNCINRWGKHFVNNPPPKSLRPNNQRNKTRKAATPLSSATKPRSIKQIEPIGDYWLFSNSHQMTTFSLEFTETQLKRLHSKLSSHIPPFEAISAIIWQSLARVRAGKEPKLVTILRNDASEERKEILSNQPIISTATSDSSPAKLELLELATMLMSKEAADEKMAIQELVDAESGMPDFIIYGANLTFVNMEGIDLYGLELTGQKPTRVDYYINGVGDEGAVLVLRSPEGGDNNSSRVVTLILPENQVPQLKEVIESEVGSA